MTRDPNRMARVHLLKASAAVDLAYALSTNNLFREAEAQWQDASELCKDVASLIGEMIEEEERADKQEYAPFVDDEEMAPEHKAKRLKTEEMHAFIEEHMGVKLQPWQKAQIEGTLDRC